MMHIWLIGMMGTGKSTIGKRVADSIGVPFVDVDERIVTDSGRSIRDLFDEGEATFRSLESSMIRAIADEAPSVVATGGGVVLDPQNVSIMRSSGTTVLLTATTKVLFERLAACDVDRPLLRREGDVENIAAAREAIYRDAADVAIDTTERDVDEVEREVLRCVDM